jgi:hypothetical protein
MSVGSVLITTSGTSINAVVVVGAGVTVAFVVWAAFDSFDRRSAIRPDSCSDLTGKCLSENDLESM